MITLHIFLLTLITVFIIDLTDILHNIKKLIWKIAFGKSKPYKDFKLKPFDCSLCMSFWVGLFYIIIAKGISIPLLAYVCLNAFLTPVYKDALLLIKDILTKALSLIGYIFYKE